MLSTRSRIWSWISATVLGSMPAKGSSSMMSLGSVIRDRAISSRRRSPPETRLALVLRILRQAELVEQARSAVPCAASGSCRAGSRGSP